ncbi:MAG: RluA family pseudouridine synthase [Deltaproteobacteria bacterium]|nr:RluA family pseudouridine synthase [Deltaproteobacteria bacterium]
MNSPPPRESAELLVGPEQNGRRLDAALKALSGLSWERARKAIATGKVSIDGDTTSDGARAVRTGMRLRIDERAPGKRAEKLRELTIVHLDASLVVVEKPAGVSTIPFGDESREEQHQTLDALVRTTLSRMLGARGRPELGVVQRLDKETSGLIVFARTMAAKKSLTQQLRLHTVHRRYLALAHGYVQGGTIRSQLVANRGDGLRGSIANPKAGQLAVTHVEPLEPLAGATLCACRLETGRTHQIRIHLSESGNPLLGERVYVRRYPGPILPAPRVMLHAAELGFRHPANERELRFESEPPEDFRERLAALRSTRY